jgi:hypothetical protein
MHFHVGATLLTSILQNSTGFSYFSKSYDHTTFHNPTLCGGGDAPTASSQDRHGGIVSVTNYTYKQQRSVVVGPSNNHTKFHRIPLTENLFGDRSRLQLEVRRQTHAFHIPVRPREIQRLT